MSKPIVHCGACNRECARPTPGVERPKSTTKPLVWSRTLVQGRFLPSCSEPCAVTLRAMIGDSPARRVA